MVLALFVSPYLLTYRFKDHRSIFAVLIHGQLALLLVDTEV